jgi:predicted transposase/invertase (TIGR01784 family)
MAQHYDKIFREVLRDIFPAVARKVLGIPDGQFKPLPVDLQYTSEREVDQLWEVTPDNGEPFVLHCEFQSTNDKQMLSRMLLYYGFLHYQRKLPIWQYVVYVGKDKLQMDYQLQANRLTYSYQLIDLKAFSYQTFLDSRHSQEVILAILADFKGEPEELIAGKIIAKLQQLTSGQLELGQRALQLVRLAVLRNLGKVVFNLTKKMAITIDIKEDDLYQEVYQEGLQKGLQKGQEEGQLAAKEETARLMLKEGFADEVVARITKLPAERVAQLRQQSEAGQ